MPKNFNRGRFNRKTDRFIEDSVSSVSGDRIHYSHDNRETTGKQNFRGNFRSGRIDRNRPRQLDPSRLQRIVEQDVDMAGGPSQSDQAERYTPYRTGRRNQLEGRQRQRGVTQRGGSTWSKVIVTSAKRYEKSFILRTLLNASRTPFIPIYYHFEGNHAVFYVEDIAAAESLASLNKKITLHDGFQIILVVKWSSPPSFSINEELKEKVKNVMSRRYDPVTKVLNLTQFHLDEELCTDYYTPLSRENVMQTVVQIIIEHIPDVLAIDASNNKIYSVEQMKPLITKAIGLKSLNLGSNKIGHVSVLDKIQGLPIEELILNQNPVCDRFEDQSTYISAMRKRFPKLIKLDGVELPPVISFDIGAEDEAYLPPCQGSWFVSDEARQVMLTFLEQYLAVYDSDDRQPLINAYYDSASLSLTCSHPPGQVSNAAARLDAYMKENRNLKRADSIKHRYQLLQQGKVDIVSFLSKLPKTQHDPRSLVVDVPVASSHLIVASVTGVFRERTERHSMVRWFQRVFVIIPHNGGFCIVNEQLHVTNATPDQVKAAFKEPPPAAVVQPTPVLPAAAVPVAQPVIPAAVDPVLKEQMVLSFAEQSGMNTEWSLKCLEENGWDFDRAAFVFSELKKANQIPAEAFIK